MKFLADENISNDLINSLRELNFEIDSVREKYRSYSDYQIIQIVADTETIIITEDKDFGDWVFAHHIKSISVILLRYEKEDYPTVKNSLILLLKLLTEKEFEKRFITINKNKLRIRKI